MDVSPPLRALMSNSIDYAGLFPPATLELEPALKNFASYRKSDDAWMLSTFVLPIAKFADAAWYLSEFSEANALRLSALGPKTTNAIDFAEELKNVARGIRELLAQGRKLVRIEQLEMPLPQNVDPGPFVGAADVAVRTFWEAPAGDAERAVALLAQENAKREQPLGFKLRTGGVTADKFPSSAQIARALLASAKYKVPIKFTAGLHHPLRMFRDEVHAKMHGFLNVLGAGVLSMEHGWDDQQTIAMLDDEDATAFGFTSDQFFWRDWRIGTTAIEKHRALVTSFGSCSFDEPREDLRALNLL
jgi:hypothetical protein